MNILAPANNTERRISSLDIAEVTGKRHPDVMRDIRNQLEALEIGLSKFAHTYLDLQGKSQPCFLLDNEQAMTLASGYDVALRNRIIKRWFTLEEQAAPRLPQTYAEALRELATTAEEVERLSMQIKADAPRVDFAKTIETAAGSVGVRDFCHAVAGEGLKIGSTRLGRLLREYGYIAKTNKTIKPIQEHIENGLFEVSELVIITPKGKKTTFPAKITGKGQVYFLAKIREWLNGGTK